MCTVKKLDVVLLYYYKEVSFKRIRYLFIIYLLFDIIKTEIYKNIFCFDDFIDNMYW